MARPVSGGRSQAGLTKRSNEPAKDKVPERLTSLRNPLGPEARALLRERGNRTHPAPTQEKILPLLAKNTGALSSW